MYIRTLHYIPLHSIPFHCMALHYIAIHTYAYIHVHVQTLHRAILRCCCCLILCYIHSTLPPNVHPSSWPRSSPTSQLTETSSPRAAGEPFGTIALPLLDAVVPKCYKPRLGEKKSEKLESSKMVFFDICSDLRSGEIAEQKHNKFFSHHIPCILNSHSAIYLIPN